MLRSDGSFVRDYLYVRDAAAAYVELADGIGRDGVAGNAFNFSDESPMTVIELVDAIRERMGKDGIEPVVLDAASARSMIRCSRRRGRATCWAGSRARPRVRARRDDRLVQGVPWLTGGELVSGTARGADGGGICASRSSSWCRPITMRNSRPGVRPRRDARPGLGPRVRRGRAAAPRRLLARLLAHDRPLREAIRARVREGGRRAPRAPLQLRLVGEPARRLGADVEEARRAPAAAGRRGDHRRGRLSDDGQPDRPQPARARLRGRRARHLQPRRVAARGSRRPADAGDHRRAHARQPVRPRRGARVREEARPVADRGQLRRPRIDLQRTS